MSGACSQALKASDSSLEWRVRRNNHQHHVLTEHYEYNIPRTSSSSTHLTYSSFGSSPCSDLSSSRSFLKTMVLRQAVSSHSQTEARKRTNVMMMRQMFQYQKRLTACNKTSGAKIWYRILERKSMPMHAVVLGKRRTTGPTRHLEDDPTPWFQVCRR
jgi:hypothetical protein